MRGERRYSVGIFATQCAAPERQARRCL